MKTIYLECKMGASGDMLMGALVDLLDESEKKQFLDMMNGAGIDGVSVEIVPTVKQGISGAHMKVLVKGEEELSEDVLHEHEHVDDHAHSHEHSDEHHHNGEHSHKHGHHHSSLADIEHIIRHLCVPDVVKENAVAVYKLIAEAESVAHGTTVKQIHFHEVGTLDAVADIVGVSLLFHMIAAEQILASPVNTGSGRVKCAHGVLPVPAPATAYLLRGIPSYSAVVERELCTPTGAALLKHFVKSFGLQPVMATEKVGYGFGTKEFDVPNCVRVFVGEAQGFGIEKSKPEYDDISRIAKEKIFRLQKL